MPFGEGYQPYLFRRWSAHTHAVGPHGSASGGSGSSYSSVGGYGSGSSLAASTGGGSSVSSGSGGAFTPFSRRWSVPASVNPTAGSTSGF